MKALVQSQWKGGEAFIIGGGASLRGFDFGVLKGRHSIGANDAFRLGPELCNMCLFADHKWWRVVKWDLENYASLGGVVYSVCPDTERFHLPWLHQFTRIESGLSRMQDHLALNCSTGAAAINLAVLLGAHRIFLLGFDMGTNPTGISHWHNHRAGPPPPSSYTRFRGGMGSIKETLDKDYPHVEVLNVTDGTSKLEPFPKIGYKEAFK